MRNGHPYSYIDLDRDPDVQKLLDSFQISASEIPVLICRGQVVLRNPSNQQIVDCLGFNESVDQTKVLDLVVVMMLMKRSTKLLSLLLHVIIIIFYIVFCHFVIIVIYSTSSPVVHKLDIESLIESNKLL
jgi:hypothetical protein